MRLSWTSERLRDLIYDQLLRILGHEYDLCYSRVGRIPEVIPSHVNTPDELRVHFENFRTPGILFIRPKDYIAGTCIQQVIRSFVNGQEAVRNVY